MDFCSNDGQEQCERRQQRRRRRRRRRSRKGDCSSESRRQPLHKQESSTENKWVSVERDPHKQARQGRSMHSQARVDQRERASPPCFLCPSLAHQAKQPPVDGTEKKEKQQKKNGRPAANRAKSSTLRWRTPRTNEKLGRTVPSRKRLQAPRHPCRQRQLQAPQHPWAQRQLQAPQCPWGQRQAPTKTEKTNDPQQRRLKRQGLSCTHLGRLRRLVAAAAAAAAERGQLPGLVLDLPLNPEIPS